LEQVLSELTSDELVSLGHGLAHQSQHEPVHGSEVVNVGRVVELLVQLHEEGQLLPILGAPAEAVPDEAVAESEGRCGDGVRKGWVDGGVVVALVATRLQLQLEDVDDGLAQDDRKPLVEGDVLDHGTHDLSGLLEEPEIFRGGY